jgi:hypothetical protein
VQGVGGNVSRPLVQGVGGNVSRLFRDPQSTSKSFFSKNNKIVHSHFRPGLAVLGNGCGGGTSRRRTALADSTIVAVGLGTRLLEDHRVLRHTPRERTTALPVEGEVKWLLILTKTLKVRDAVACVVDYLHDEQKN